MRKILNIGNEAYQRHAILFEESEIILELRYLSPVQIWIMNVEYKDWSISGVKLSCGVQHFRGSNMPFDFIVTDNLGYGQDPFRLADFSDERCTLFLLEPTELAVIRGTSVQI